MLHTGYYYSDRLNKYMATSNYLDYHKYLASFQPQDGIEAIIDFENILKLKAFLYHEIQQMMNDRKQLSLPAPNKPIERTFMGELIIFHTASRLDIKLLFKVDFYNFIETVLATENAQLYFFYTATNVIMPTRLLALF